MNESKNVKKINKSKNFVSMAEAVEITGINAQSLRRMADEEKIKCYKTISGQRKFDRQYLEEMCNSTSFNKKIQQPTTKNYIYTRVSSRKQMDDLSRQLEYIKNKRTEYATYIPITDVASGINFNRKGLSTILDECLQGTLGEVVVAHRDRLSRFGFDLIKLIVEKQGGKITVFDDEQNKSSEQELAEDLLSIIHIFSCRQMGKRSYSCKKSTKNTESETTTESTTENNN